LLEIVRRGLLGLALLVVLGVGALVLLVVLGPPLSLNALRPSLVAAASEAMGREVEIRGDIRLVPALWPTLGVRRVRVGNPDGFEGMAAYFARFEEAHGQIELLAFLRGELRIGEVRMEGAHFALETTADGRNNWTFGAEASGDPKENARELLEIRSLELHDVHVSYREGSSGGDYELAIDNLVGALTTSELELSLVGNAGPNAYEIDLRTDRLAAIRRLYEPWALDVEGRIAGIPVTGRTVLEMRTNETSAELTLLARGGEIGELIEMLAGRPGIEGRFDRLELRVATAGADLHEWVDAAELHVQLAGGALSYGNEAGARPVRFTLEEAALDVAPGGPVVGRAQGSLLDEPTRLTFTGGSAVTLLDGVPWPLALEGEGAGAVLGLSGLLGGSRAGDAPHRFRVKLAGGRLGDLAPWLGVPETAPSAYRVHGDLEAGAGGLTLSSASFALGRTRGLGTLDWRSVGEGPGPRVSLQLAMLDIDELDDNLDPDPEAGPGDTAGLTIDCPILPERVSIRDADLEIRVDRMDLDPTDVTGLAFSARIRDSRVTRAPFAARYGGVDFRGELDLDLAQEAPVAALRVATGALDVGDLARAAGLASNLDARAARFSLDLRLRGRTARELLSGAAFEAAAEEGMWRVDTELLTDEVRFQRVSWRARPGGRVASEFEGELRAVPIAIQTELPALLDLVLPDYVFPAELHVDAAGARLDLALRLSLPIRYVQGDVAFKLSGARLSDLGPLVGVSLPPFGPYAVTGTLDRRAGGYDATYDLRVRESRLSGTTQVDTTGSKPRVSAVLEAPNVQLADFRYEGWSPATAEPAAPSDRQGKVARVKPFLSHAVLGAFNGEASLRVDEVRSGKDSLGRGSLQATLQDGRLVLDPLDLDFSGGEVALALAVEPRPDDVEVSLRARVDRFDYGVLARRLDARSTQSGLISLDADVQARGPDLSTLTPGASGWIEVALRPENLAAGALELLATNILRSTLRLLSPFSSPRVNCVVGAFEIDEGVLESRAILLDTTSMQVHGSGYADFRTGALRFEFTPRPKRSEVLSLALPVVAEGTLPDVRTRIRPEDPVRSLARQVGNAIRIPFESIFRGGLPADGRPACLALLEAARESSGRVGAPIGAALLE